MSAEQTPHELSLVEEEPDDVVRAAVTPLLREIPRQLTWQEHLAKGDLAYAEAVAREEARGLDNITIEKYEEASKELLAVTATGPIVNSESEPADPIRLLKIAGSLAKQAQVASNEFYSTYGSRHIDVKSNKQKIAAETLQRASRMMMGEESHADHTAMIAEFDVESPGEAVVAAAVEAAKETGTAEYVFGAEAVNEDTSERLELEGEDAVVKFIGTHALEAGPQGLEFVARTAEIAVEAVGEMTGEHQLPLAA